MEKARAFLFDLDGTLLDSRKAIVNVIYRLCRKYGVHVSYGEVESQFSSSFRQIFSSFSRSSKEEMQQDYIQWMLREDRKCSRLFPAIRESLLFLKYRGDKLALVTNKERLIVEENLDRLSLVDYFDAVVTCSDVQNPKPYAEPVEKALGAISAPKNEALMIGDSVFDVQAAGNAGIPSVVIDWYNCYPLDQIKPTYYFNNIGEMINNLCRVREVV